MRNIGGNQKERTSGNGTCLLPDCQLEGSFQQNPSLFVRMMMQGNLSSVIHLQVRQHQMSAERRSHSTTGDWLDRSDAVEVYEGHVRARMWAQWIETVSRRTAVQNFAAAHALFTRILKPDSDRKSAGPEVLPAVTTIGS